MLEETATVLETAKIVKEQIELEQKCYLQLRLL